MKKILTAVTRPRSLCFTFVIVAIILFYGFLIVWPVQGASITKTFRMYFPVDPAKVTCGTSIDFTYPVPALMTPYVSASAPWYVDRTITIDDSAFVYLFWSIHWYNAADAPTTVIQPYCGQNRIKIGTDSTIARFPFAFGGATADTAIVEAYRNNAASPYEADTCTSCDSMLASLYILDTATTTVRFRALFYGDQWVQDPDLTICPAVSQLLDTITDTIAADTVTVVAAGCIEESGGNVTHRIWCRDTANATFVSGARLSVYNASGQWVGGTITGDSGFVDATLISGNSYTYRIYQPLYQWSNGSITAAASGSDTAKTYRLPNYSNGYVPIYLSVGSGAIDSVTGGMIPRGAELTLRLVGQPFLNDGTWAILPQDMTRRPNSQGAVEWIVPANTILTGRSHYELYATSNDGWMQHTELIRKFFVDTASTPQNILELTRIP